MMAGPAPGFFAPILIDVEVEDALVLGVPERRANDGMTDGACTVCSVDPCLVRVAPKIGVRVVDGVLVAVETARVYL